MTDLSPNREDLIRGKLLAFDGWTLRGRAVVEDDVKFRVVAQRLLKLSDELWMLSNTTVEEGRKLGWWK